MKRFIVSLLLLCGAGELVGSEPISNTTTNVPTFVVTPPVAGKKHVRLMADDGELRLTLSLGAKPGELHLRVTGPEGAQVVLLWATFFRGMTPERWRPLGGTNVITYGVTEGTIGNAFGSNAFRAVAVVE